jgi:hypothetical protein
MCALDTGEMPSWSKILFFLIVLLIAFCFMVFAEAAGRP